MKIILLDNYDSFTFNLYHYISSFKTKVDVIRNDKINSTEIIKKKLRGEKVNYENSGLSKREWVELTNKFGFK